MRLYALVSETTRRQIGADPWLSSFAWQFIDEPGEVPTAPSSLLVLEAGQLSASCTLDGLGCACWCFGVETPEKAFPPHCDLFAQPLDTAWLGDRLLAWMWVEGELSPACLAGAALTLANGRLSVATVPLNTRAVQIAVSPTDLVGGDMALYWRQGDRALAVLADAIGHGDIAALDVAQFMLDVVRLLRTAHLSPDALTQLCRHQAARLARGRFVAAALVEMDFTAGTLAVVNAGMPPVLCLRAGQSLMTYPSTQPPLGLADCPCPIVQVAPLRPGHQWLLASDGADVAALCRELAAVEFVDLAQGASKAHPSFSMRTIPIAKAPGIVDDASQIVLFIPDK